MMPLLQHPGFSYDMKIRHVLLVAVAVAFAGAEAASAATTIDLSGYQVTGSYTLDTLGGMGLEASAVAYARDRGTLFFVGDEGTGVVEISRTGQTIGSMAFNWSGTGSSNNDAEGLTYLGNGRLVVVDERPQIAYRFDYADGGTVALNNQPKVAITGSTTPVGNVGTEGISFDPVTGKFFSVKQDTPAELRVADLTFAVGFGTATPTTLFSGASSLFGLNSLSDVQTLSGVDGLTGPAASNLLVLSLDSKALAEIDPSTGTVVSLFNLASLTTQAIEGVTVDELGNIYLVAENAGASPSQLFVLSHPAPVPLPGAVWLLGSAIAGVAGFARRRRREG
jgi:uncharacterized protein YjiK